MIFINNPISTDNSSVDKNDVLIESSKLGYPLPDELAEFYLLYNGGIPHRKHPPIPNDKLQIDSIFPLLSEKDEHLNICYSNSMNFSEFLPDNFLAFANDPFGNLFCIKYRGSDVGSIYFYDVDSDNSQMRFLSPSLSQFINSLT